MTTPSNSTDQDSQIRVRTPDDIPACVRGLKEVYESDGYPVEGVSDAEGWLFPDGLLEAWVAEEGGEVLGHAAACEPRGEAAVTMLIDQTGMTEDQIAVIARLFVVPRGRGKSFGQRLAFAAFEYAQRLGRRIVFDVMTKDQAAIRLYERLGCVRLGTTTHVFGDGQEVPAYCYVAPETQP
ncbi:GNAT family N-acetyltransferase [Actinocatenispora rupis]|uniref:GNAT family N-acetyltransferase n=1 Tax=Actinocatenispora rupis TaxID=519421 RepID=A0A8J3J7I9_9ACTN|nr:GNAT family N-acetyltransferase [Actinocatenispora rupis]GID13081.1 GNAT family N-acetyltransferase [Actinocatenispora rupis]